VRPARSSVYDSRWGWRPNSIKTECTPWNVNHYVPWAFRSLPAKTTFQQTTAQPSILDQHQSAQGEPKKGHYRIIDFGKELNHGFGKLKPSTAVDYRALVKKKFLASFRWSRFRLRNNHFSNPHCCGVANLISAYLVLDMLSKSLGRCTSRFKMSLLTIEWAISSRLSVLCMAPLTLKFFPSGKFSMWYLLVICKWFLNDIFTLLRIAESFSRPVCTPKQKILTFHCSLLLLRSLGSQTNIYQPTAVKITSLPLKDKQRSRNAVSRVLITLVSDILANAECNLVSIELDWQIHSIFTEWISKIYDSILPG